MDDELRRFVHDLHFDIDRTKPPDWETNWADAPLPFKLYRHLPAYPLSTDIPLSLAHPRTGGRADARELAHCLWYAYGTARVSRSAVPPDGPPEWAGPSELYRRVVPSGGGLYPNELYVYLKLPELPQGVYHYDAAHHRLVLLREGCFDDYLDQTLGGRFDMASCFGAVFVTTVFWKNFFKYANFAYRLQGLDAGVLLGQLLESGARFGYQQLVCFQFLDRALGRLLGLAEGEESVYAVVLLTDGDGTASEIRRNNTQIRRAVTADDLISGLPEAHFESFVRSRNRKEYPLLIRMDAASRYDTTAAFREAPPVGAPAVSGNFPVIPLPPVRREPYDFAEVSRKRFSPEMDFVLKPVGCVQLAGVLRETALSSRYFNDLEATGGAEEPRVSLYGCFYGIEGIGNGAYRYDSGAHSLMLLRPGDHRGWLQYGMTLHNVNLFQVPLIFHVAGDRGHGLTLWGARGYRIQQMEAGMLVQRLLLAASAAGMGGRPLLGYDAEASDDLYRLPAAGETALIQVPVGPYRRRPRWEGGMFR